MFNFNKFYRYLFRFNQLKKPCFSGVGVCVSDFAELFCVSGFTGVLCACPAFAVRLPSISFRGLLFVFCSCGLRSLFWFCGLGLLGLGGKVCEMSGSKRWLMNLDKKLFHKKLHRRLRADA